MEAHRYSQTLIFNDFIEHFYEIKKHSSGPTKFISKLMLNTLYGVFGRKQELLKTININSKDINDYTNTHIVKNVLEIDNDIYTLLVYQNLDVDTINELNVTLDTDISDKVYSVKSNVAIAAAVTAYARIHMIQFKTLPGVYYTDTDSIFIDRALPGHLIGKELGMMDNELSDNIEINRALFLGNKKYFIEYVNTVTGELTCKSVVAGVRKNSLTFDDGLKILAGENIICRKTNVFIHDNSKLSITIKDLSRSVKFNPDKSLVGNNYIPLQL